MQKDWQVNFYYLNFNENQIEIKKVLNSLKEFCKEFHLNESLIESKEFFSGHNEDGDLVSTELEIRMNFIHKADENFHLGAKNFLVQHLWEEKFIQFSFDIFESQFKSKYFCFNDFIEFKKPSFYY